MGSANVELPKSPAASQPRREMAPHGSHLQAGALKLPTIDYPPLTTYDPLSTTHYPLSLTSSFAAPNSISTPIFRRSLLFTSGIRISGVSSSLIVPQNPAVAIPTLGLLASLFFSASSVVKSSTVSAEANHPMRLSPL